MSIVCLMYHAIVRDEQEFEALSQDEKVFTITLETFLAQLKILDEMDAAIVHPKELIQERPQFSNRKHQVLITFDDGHRTLYEVAYPILKAKGLSAVAFVTTDFMGQDSQYCTWEMLKEMAANGIHIQTHGHTHRFFTDLSDKEAIDELVISKQLVEKHTEKNVYALSFPGGYFKRRDITLAHKVGYRLCFTSDTGIIDTADFGYVQELPRIAIRCDTSIETFRKVITGDTKLYFKMQLKTHIKNWARALIGSQLYYKIYQLRSKKAKISG